MISVLKQSSSIVRSQTRGIFGSATAVSQISVDEEIPHIPQPRGAPAPEIKYSTLSNGIKIGTDNSCGPIAKISVTIRAGSMYENEENAGISHLLEKMAFRCTRQRSDIRLYRDVENIGGKIWTSFSRNSVSFAVSVLPENAPKAVDILAESTMHPLFAPWDIELRQNLVSTENSILESSPSFLLSEALHSTAFRSTPLGRSLISSENVNSLTSDMLMDFHFKHCTTSGICVSCVGMDHKSLEHLAEKSFSGVPTHLAPPDPKSKYYGGEMRQNALGKKAYVALGFEGTSWSKESIAASFTLETLLQRSGFSCFNSIYDDTGLFGLMGSSNPEKASGLVDGMLEVLRKYAYEPISPEELVIGKALSSRSFGDTYDSREGKNSMLVSNMFSKYSSGNSAIFGSKEIHQWKDSVTAHDVSEFAKKLIESRPTLVSIGKINHVPYLDEVLEKIRK